MNKQNNTPDTAAPVKTLTAFTTAGIASALAAIARRSSRAAKAAKSPVNSDSDFSWCARGAG